MNISNFKEYFNNEEYLITPRNDRNWINALLQDELTVAYRIPQNNAYYHRKFIQFLLINDDKEIIRLVSFKKKAN